MMTRREALKGLFYTGMGLAVGGPLLQACRPGAQEAPAGIPCNACLPKCPQHIRIPDQLKRISDLVSRL